MALNRTQPLSAGVQSFPKLWLQLNRNGIQGTKVTLQAFWTMGTSKEPQKQWQTTPPFRARVMLTALLRKWCPSRTLVIGRDMKQIKLFFVPLPELSKHWTTNVKSSLILIKQNPSVTSDEFWHAEKSRVNWKNLQTQLGSLQYDWRMLLRVLLSYKSFSVIGWVGWSLKREEVYWFPKQAGAFQIFQDLSGPLGAQ